MKKLIAALILAGVTSGSVQAQSTFMWAAPPSTANGPVFKYYLPMGTPLALRTRTQISTKEARTGDRVYLEVAEAVMFRGQTVVPVGSPVTGEVAALQRNGHFGRKGKITVRLIEVQTPSGPVRLSGEAYDEGVSGTVVSIGTFILLSPLGFLVHGTSGSISSATPVKAYLAENLNFRWQQPEDTQALAGVEATPDHAGAPALSYSSPE